MKRTLLLSLAVVGLALFGINRDADSQSGPDGGCFDGNPCCAAFPDGGLIYCNGSLQCMYQEAKDGGTICHNDNCNAVGSYCCYNGSTPYCNGYNHGVALKCVPAGTPVFNGLSFTPYQSCQ